MLILCIAVPILALLSYFIGKEDIINPIFLCVSIFVASIFSALYNIETWKINLSSTTVALILLSLSSMVIFGYVGLHLKSSRKRSKLKLNHLPYIEVPNYKIIAIVLLGLFATILYFRDVLIVARRLGYSYGGGIGTIIGTYRNASSFNVDLENRVSRISSYSMEAFRVSAYLCLYIGIQNIIVSKKNKKNIKYILIVLLFCVSTIVTGSRMQLIKVTLFAVIVAIILYRRNTGENKKIKLKTIAKIFLLFALVMVAFVGIRTVVGRSGIEDPLYYFTRYAGGSIELLDIYLREGHVKNQIFGQESLYAFYNFFGNHFGINELQQIHAREFRRSANGVSVGNIYTALRTLYNDFGFIGCIVCSGLIGLAVSYFYSRIKSHNKFELVDMGVVLYGYLSYSYCLYSINYYFEFVTPAFIKTIIMFYLMRYFILSFGIKGVLKSKKVWISYESRV